jgi:hypothetical protein
MDVGGGKRVGQRQEQGMRAGVTKTQTGKQITQTQNKTKTESTYTAMRGADFLVCTHSHDNGE